MSTKSFKYFHKGDKWGKIIDFFVDLVAQYDTENDIKVINKKIKITIEVYEDE